MASLNNHIVVAMADSQSLPTELNNHDSKDLAGVNRAASAVAPSPDDASPNMANEEATGIYEPVPEHEHEHKHDITTRENVHEEEKGGFVDDTSDLISEADEAIAAVAIGLGMYICSTAKYYFG